ncbi:MAG: response regulator transcription factor [Betaproteobacteria bacterium]|nr:response regulator transcription factor [Betaproteobacteria bacterium]
MTRILLVDDDVDLCELLGEYLAGEGFAVDAAHDGESALLKAVGGGYDVIVLDVMMPGRNGFDVLRELRARDGTPVLMLTARGEDVDSIVGLELGADDYLAKPCNPRVLVARIRAVLRRAEQRAGNGEAGEAGEATQWLHLDDLDLHPGSRAVRRAGKPVEMTSTEFSVLAVLMRQAGRVVPKNELAEQGLGRKLARFDRSLDMHVSNLRRKLGPAPDGEERIKTVRGVGYQYVAR